MNLCRFIARDTLGLFYLQFSMALIKLQSPTMHVGLIETYRINVALTGVVKCSIYTGQFSELLDLVMCVVKLSKATQRHSVHQTGL